MIKIEDSMLENDGPQGFMKVGK